MQYKVTPFHADVMVSEGAEKAAQQLSDLINENAAEGWNYLRLETIVTRVTTPGTEGTSGCFGIGATPGTPQTTKSVEVYVAVFSKA